MYTNGYSRCYGFQQDFDSRLGKKLSATDGEKTLRLNFDAVI